MKRIRMLALVLASASASTSWAADEPDELMPGRVVIVKQGKVAKFVSKPATGGSFDLPDVTNDPTVEGGTLNMFDPHPFGPASNSYALPATGWTGLGNPAGSKGYRYRGAGSAGDPCRLVLVKDGVVKAVCKGAGVTMATPFLAEVGIVLTVGTDSKRYCAVFGGTEARNDASLLKRRDAPAPGACPLNLMSSTTFVPTTTSTSSTETTSTSATTNTGGSLTTTSTTSTTVP